MKKVCLLIVMAGVLLGLCPPQEQNPLLSEFSTPFGVPPFEQIKEEHYLPTFKAGIEQQKQEIAAIVKIRTVPTFDNTIEALEKSGALLDKVSSVFGNLTAAHTNEKLQEIDKVVTPMLSKHMDDIMLNDLLFQKVKAVYEQKEKFNLTAEQDKLLEEYYKSFVRGGANLNEQQKAELREIN